MRGEQREITAQVYNQARVPPKVLISAEKEAEYALETAAVHVRWINCDRPAICDDAVQDELLILVRQAAPAGLSPSHEADAMGLALLPHNDSGVYAMVYYREICRLAEISPAVTSAEILGYVMAHEIGHLLLGPKHQNGTVMQGQWGRAEFELIRQRALRFNRAQRLARSRTPVAGEGTLFSALRNDQLQEFLLGRPRNNVYGNVFR